MELKQIKNSCRTVGYLLQGPHESDSEYGERMREYELIISKSAKDSKLVKKATENGGQKD